MKKSILVSSVAAFALVGMLAFVGCGGNSGHKNDPIKPSKPEISVVKGDGTTTQIEAKLTKGDQSNTFKARLVRVSGTSSKSGATCEQAAATPQKDDDCKVTVKPSCHYKTDPAKGSKNDAFKVLESLNLSVGKGKEYRYAGTLELFTEDDINEATLYVGVDFNCGAIGKDGRIPWVNGSTAKPNSKVLVVLTDKEGNILKDADGNPVTKEGKLKYKNNDGTPSGAYVEFENGDGISLGGHGLNDVGGAYFYIEMEEVISNPVDLRTGATGGSGATGAGG